MPLHVRSIAMNTSVICFFVCAFGGLLSGLAPFTCCKRALLGAAASYIVTALAVRATNAVITSAIIARQINKHKENSSAARNRTNS